ncbi:putative AT-hook motif nuclear-localized protein [Helianthus annuus]|nr:putative AT-hook motif nuclear-localized protein [Helianthus annuus]
MDHHQNQQFSGLMMPPNSYYNNKDSNLINPFNSSDHFVDGSGQSGGFGDGGYGNEPEKKKRGRPRKHKGSPDGDIAIGLAPVDGGGNLECFDGNGGSGSVNVDSSGKRQRGRPAGVLKRQLDALGVAGSGFTPHVIVVKEGEDIASTMVSFSKEGPRTICILSANGAISNVTLQQSAIAGGTVTYEGRFEIISLSGSFVYSESDDNGNHSKASGLSVSLAGSDGRVLGGGVAGVLVAASPVQVIVGSFVTDGKKAKSSIEPSPEAPPNMLSFGGGGGAVPGTSPQSDGPSGEPSDESGGSPDHMFPDFYKNATEHQHQHQQQPQEQPSTTMQNLQMYANMGWPSSTMNMLPN